MSSTKDMMKAMEARIEALEVENLMEAAQATATAFLTLDLVTTVEAQGGQWSFDHRQR